MCGNPVQGVVNSVTSLVKKPDQPAGEAVPINSAKPEVGQPETTKTGIGDAAAAKLKPRSLLSQAGGGGDTTAANTGTAYGKPNLGS